MKIHFLLDASKFLGPINLISGILIFKSLIYPRDQKSLITKMVKDQRPLNLRLIIRDLIIIRNERERERE